MDVQLEIYSEDTETIKLKYLQVWMVSLKYTVIKVAETV